MLPVKYSFEEKGADWLWLSPAKHPERIKTRTTVFSEIKEDTVFTAAEFRKTFSGFGDGVHETEIYVFADTKFQLYINETYLGTGPVAAGGDYGNTLPMPVQYINRYRCTFSGDSLSVNAVVHTMPEVMTDYSCGRGGFVLNGVSEGIDFVSDDSWECSILEGYRSASEIDLTVQKTKADPYVLSENEKVWNTYLADMEMVTEEEMIPVSETRRTGNGKNFLELEYSRIYSAYMIISAENTSEEPSTVRVRTSETEHPSNDSLVIRVPVGKSEIRTLRIYSLAYIEAESDAGTSISVKISYVHYPVDHGNEGFFRCSDEMLNRIYDTGKFTLEMCRQSLHLDSPMHQETLGCTGDYAIESLITRMTFGDMKISALDIIRTADYLVMTDGYMFHTSYALIWAMMLNDYYTYTGDRDTLLYCIPALNALMKKYRGYVGPHGVIETPINCMFIDWANIDGFQMHHPPLSLGQTSLNAFYYGALRNAALIYRTADIEDKAVKCEKDADSLKEAFRESFYDVKKQIFRDGFTKSESDYEPTGWMPANTEKTYYTRHCNILAVRFGLVEGEEAKDLLSKVAECDKLDAGTDADVQPYFMHYFFEALRITGLFGKYGLKYCHKWDGQIEESPKGMKEGWGEFRGDRSHAWGATPTYHLPLMISGFELTGTGFSSFRLDPDLYGLEYASIGIPSPYGLIKLDISEKGYTVSVPDAFEEKNGNYILK